MNKSHKFNSLKELLNACRVSKGEDKIISHTSMGGQTGKGKFSIVDKDIKEEREKIMGKKKAVKEEKTKENESS